MAAFRIALCKRFTTVPAMLRGRADFGSEHFLYFLMSCYVVSVEFLFGKLVITTHEGRETCPSHDGTCSSEGHASQEGISLCNQRRHLSSSADSG